VPAKIGAGLFAVASHDPIYLRAVRLALVILAPRGFLGEA
jgi:hypothetical protein